MFKHNPEISIENYRAIERGDVLTLGKRRWEFYGTTAESHPGEQEESVWVNASPDPGAVDAKRVMAWSEVEALVNAGFLSRMVPATIKFGGLSQGPVSR